MSRVSRTFLLIGITVVILLALHLLPTISVGGIDLRHINIMSDVIPEVYCRQDSEGSIPKPAPPKTHPTQSQSTTKGMIKKQLHQGVTMIDDYSAGADGGMDHFYTMLSRVNSIGRPVRIAYYGDSFIEGDILTSDLREELQKRFGGNGVGWVDCGSEINGFRRTISQKFNGITEYEVVKKPFSHKNEGINQRYYVPEENATISTSGTKYRTHAAKWQVAKLFFRTVHPLAIHTSTNGGLWQTFNMEGEPCVQMLEKKGDMRDITYRFTGVDSAIYLYGMALESETGVILDNFSMRGSSGNTLANIPQTTLKDFARLRPYDLIVIHFGLNIVNEKSNAANYSVYVKRMRHVVDNMRKAFPEASILIVSVPDRAQRSSVGIKTMNGIEALAAYQQVLASDCNVAYFNLFQAMGGTGSMKAMVDKGLANKDYTHLSFAGGAHVAKYLYDSFMAGFENYRLRSE